MVFRERGRTALCAGACGRYASGPWAACEGQGFYLACVDCKTSANVFAPHEEKGYESKPRVTLLHENFGGRLGVLVKDRQDYEVKVFDSASGKLEQKVSVKGVGDFGVHGSVSATVQNGQLALLGRNDLVTTTGK